MRLDFSNTVTSACPTRASCCAVASPCRPGADDSDFLAGLRAGYTCGAIQPSSQPLSTMKCSIDLMPTASLLMFSVHAAFAGRRADATGELGEVVGAVQGVERLPVVAAKDKIVPVGNDVVDRAAGLAERDAQSMQRAPCCLASSSFSVTTNSR